LLEPQAVVVGRVLKELRRLLENVFALDLLELEVVLGRVAAERVLVVRRRRGGPSSGGSGSRSGSGGE
jgi:hypothetical protein